MYKKLYCSSTQYIFWYLIDWHSMRDMAFDNQYSPLIFLSTSNGRTNRNNCKLLKALGEDHC